MLLIRQHEHLDMGLKKNITRALLAFLRSTTGRYKLPLEPGDISHSDDISEPLSNMTRSVLSSWLAAAHPYHIMKRAGAFA